MTKPTGLPRGRPPIGPRKGKALCLYVKPPTLSWLDAQASKRGWSRSKLIERLVRMLKRQDEGKL